MGPDRLEQRHAMVEGQLRYRGIRDGRVLAAMLEVPRHEFVPADEAPFAYEDRPLPIGAGQTISQPYMVAYMLELLQVGPEHRVLEVGAGSGYQAALLGELAREVWALELVPELAARAAATLARLGSQNVHIVQGDGSAGYPQAAPYDRIIFAAGAPRVPEEVEQQLTEGGRLVIPVGPLDLQMCMVGIREEGSVRFQDGQQCRFVPLLGERGWRT